MKKRFLVLMCVGILVLCGCVNENSNEITDLDSANMSIADDQVEDEVTDQEENQTTEQTANQVADPETETNIVDDSEYIGEYLDYDCNEPNLEIAKETDGKYIVQIGIFRLTTLDDGVGELTPEGMVFTATDAAGNPISGMITVEDEIATVTFTDSTWSLIENGTSYMYSKSSDIANVWGE